MTDSRRGWMAVGAAALCCTTGCTVPKGAANTDTAVARRTDPTLEAHVQGYAMAYCLRSLDSKGLPEPDARVIREQGDRWTSVVIERSAGDVGLFFAMMPALDTAIAATPMAYVKDEANAGSATAPVYYCAALLRQPAVVRAMATATAALAPAYDAR